MCINNFITYKDTLYLFVIIGLIFGDFSGQTVAKSDNFCIKKISKWMHQTPGECAFQLDLYKHDVLSVETY